MQTLFLSVTFHEPPSGLGAGVGVVVVTVVVVTVVVSIVVVSALMTAKHIWPKKR